MSQISQEMILPINWASGCIKEIIHNKISSRRIKLDRGTAKKFVSQKVRGN
jgi:hypothetical protein